MRTLSIFQHNSDDDRRYYRAGQFGAEFPDLTFESRFALNTALYENAFRENNKTIFTHQEGNDVARDKLKEFYTGLGMTVLTTKYCLHAGSYNFVFAYNAAVFEVVETSQVYYTQSGLSTTDEERNVLSRTDKVGIPSKDGQPGKIGAHLGEEFEKSAQLVRLRHIATGTTFLIVNTHLGLSMGMDPVTKVISPEINHRMLALQKLCDALSREQGMVILTGDFNQFDARSSVPAIYYDQIRILQNNGFHWASEGLSRIGMKSTFVCKPGDFFHLLSPEKVAAFKATLTSLTDPNERRQFVMRTIQEEGLNLIGICLDATFTRGLPQNAMVSVNAFTMFSRRVVNADTGAAETIREVVNTSKVENSQEFHNRYLQHFINHRADAGVEPPLPSDHFALATRINFAP